MAIDWQNGYEGVLSDRTVLTDSYIKVTPVPTPSEGRLVLEDTSKDNYEIIHYTSKDAGGVYTTAGGARNQDGNSTGIHPKNARVRQNITAQDMRQIRDYSLNIVQNSGMPTVVTETTPATLTPATTSDIITVTGLANNLTIAAPTGTPYDGKIIILRLKDNGISRSITWNAVYENISGVDMITLTTAGKWHIFGIVYLTLTNKYQIVSISTGA